MNFIHVMKLVLLGLSAAQTEEVASQTMEVDCVDRQITQDFTIGEYVYIPECVGFTIGPDTDCTWMSEYCQEQLDTRDYFFFEDICKYDETNGYQGSPESGEQYVCCTN